MFSVIFEVLPDKANWGDYINNDTMLRPELEQVEGFVDNIRYKSLTRAAGSSPCRTGVTRNRSCAGARVCDIHEVQQKGRDVILSDSHLRVGKITADNRLPEGYTLAEQRLDQTGVGEGTAITLINATRPANGRRLTILTTVQNGSAQTHLPKTACHGTFLTRSSHQAI